MIIQIDSTKIRQIEAILRDANLCTYVQDRPAEHESVLGGTTYLNIRDTEDAVNVLVKLKQIGAFTAVTNTVGGGKPFEAVPTN